MNRLLRRVPDTPWFSTPAVEFLARIIQPHWRVLECGSGRSTAWYGRHVCSVLALEDQPAWYAQVVRLVDGRANVSIDLLPCREFPARVSAEPAGSFDLVVVDGNEHDEHGERLPAHAGRPGCVHAAIRILRIGGVLIVDNSDLPQYREVDESLAAWHSTRFRGFPYAPMTPTETTSLWKPPSFSTP